MIGSRTAKSTQGPPTKGPFKFPRRTSLDCGHLIPQEPHAGVDLAVKCVTPNNRSLAEEKASIRVFQLSDDLQTNIFDALGDVVRGSVGGRGLGNMSNCLVETHDQDDGCGQVGFAASSRA